MKIKKFSLSKLTKYLGLAFVFVCLMLLIFAFIALSRVENYQNTLEDYLAETFNTSVRLGRVEGRLRSLNPAVVLDSLYVFQPDMPDKVVLRLKKVVFELDILRSLLNLSPVFKRVVLKDGEMQLILADGSVRFPGFKMAGSSEMGRGILATIDLLEQQEYIDFENFKVSIIAKQTSDKTQAAGAVVSDETGGRAISFEIADFHYERTSDQKKIMGNILSSDGDRVQIIVRTGADSFSSWPDIDIEGFMAIEGKQIGNWIPFYQAMIGKSNLPFQIEKMHVGAKIWFDWSRHRSWKVTANVDIPVASIDSKLWSNRDKIPELTNFSTQILLKGHPKKTDIWLHKTQLKLADAVLRPTDYFVSVEHPLPEFLATLSPSDFNNDELAVVPAASGKDNVTRTSQDPLLDPPALGQISALEILTVAVPVKDSSKTKYKIAADMVHLKSLHRLVDKFVMPASVKSILSDLSPTGKLNRLAIEFMPADFSNTFKLVADAEKVAINAWSQAPSASGLSGQLIVNANKGLLNIASSDFSLGLPRLFNNVWRYDQASGNLKWRIEDQGVRIFAKQLLLNGMAGELNGDLNIFIPLKNNDSGVKQRSSEQNLKTGKTDPGSVQRWEQRIASASEPEVTVALKIEMKNGNALSAYQFLPGKILSPDLTSWLQSAIRGGNLPQAGFIWHSVHGKKKISYDWGFYSKLSQATFAYSDNWPKLKDISGQLLVDKNHLSALADRSGLYDMKITPLSVTIDNFEAKKNAEPVVSIRGSMKMTGDDLLRLFNETPISEHPAVALRKQWKISGDISSGVSLDIPIKNVSAYHYNIKANTKNAAFEFSNLGLAFKNIAGRLTLDSRKGPHSPAVHADLFGQPVTMTVGTLKHQSKDTTMLSMNGRMSAKSLASWAGQPVPPWADGMFSYNAKVILPSAGKARIEIGSDLQDIAMRFPEPLSKKKGVSLPLQLVVEPSLESTDFSLRLGDLLQALVRTDEQGAVQKANIHLGEGNPVLPESGSSVTGNLADLDVMAWKTWYHNNASFDMNSTFSAETSLFRVQDVVIGKMKFGKMVLDNVTTSVHVDSESFAVLVRTRLGEGTLFFPLQSDAQPVRINLKQLNISKRRLNEAGLGMEMADGQADSQNGAEQAVSDPLSDIIFSDIPRSDIRIESLRYEGEYLGSLRAQLHPSNNRLFIRNISGVMGKMNVKGTVEWSRYDGQDKSRFSGVLSSTQLNKTLGYWGYPNQIESKEAEFNVDLNWKGSPVVFETDHLTGNVKVRIKKGRFLSKEAGGASILRVFGILNLDTLTRRLRLDFSDLFKSGLAFDSVKGVIQFNQGILSLHEPLDVRGPSSSFKLAGDIDMIQDKLDMEMVVILPVTENLPLVGLLIGQPQIAGAFYLFDKLLGRSNKLTSIRYVIKGSREKPVVKMGKLFSNKVKSKSMKAQKK